MVLFDSYRLHDSVMNDHRGAVCNCLTSLVPISIIVIALGVGHLLGERRGRCRSIAVCLDVNRLLVVLFLVAMLALGLREHCRVLAGHVLVQPFLNALVDVVSA